ncbi:MAG: Ketopantoate reductase PanG (EC [uncultured Thiotrichaceae bacterium]|uniref:Ketopantoate reductase PanG (EC) n=1 Tax=uncultured Thiotrichaceae bacterium TaxID=298394 RepID=A0A6S6U629_9GAMM|nr:MAG: Ketopantoate reductase PanG (EC [uncultured Thiotrichaceae bacterium]
MKTMNIIGAGHVGQTLGRLWTKERALELGDVVNSSVESAQVAVDFMQAGRALSDVREMQYADLFLVGCPDSYIEECCQALVESEVLKRGDIVFHCSGALSSELLKSAQEQGAYTASLHPVKSFSEPARAVQQFAGTYCGVEGDEEAVRVLHQLIENIGGLPFSIDPQHKAIYHSASVMACNYLVALQEVSLQALIKSGVQRGQAMQILHPLVAGTVSNIFEQGTADALTGPIARGDHEVVKVQLEALQDWQPDIAKLYKQLGAETVKLSQQQGKALAADLGDIERLLKN